MSSAEFAEWIAFWTLEAEMSGAESDREPSRDQLWGKIQAWAQRHNAGLERSR